MDAFRRKLLVASAGGGAALALARCGGGGGGYSSPAPAPMAAHSCGATAISANHGHSLTFPTADTSSTTPKTYDITGTANHSHNITLSVAQLQSIKGMTAVTVTSTVGDGGYGPHTHDVTTNCT